MARRGPEIARAGGGSSLAEVPWDCRDAGHDVCVLCRPVRRGLTGCRSFRVFRMCVRHGVAYGRDGFSLHISASDVLGFAVCVLLRSLRDDCAGGCALRSFSFLPLSASIRALGSSDHPRQFRSVVSAVLHPLPAFSGSFRAFVFVG